MLTFLTLIKKNLIIAIPIAMALGLLTGSLISPQFLKISILPLTILMIYPMMVSLNLGSVFSRCDLKLQGTTQLINLIVFPLLAFGIGQLFLSDRPLVAFGLLLIGLLPTSGMTISWTGFAKGNVPIAIKMTLIGLVLGAVITPLYGSVLMGKTVSIPLLRTFRQIALVVFVPMVLGFLTQWLLKKKYGAEKFNKKFKPKFPLVSTLGVLGIIFVAMSLKAKAILADPTDIFILLIPLVVFYGLSFTLTSLIGKLFFNRPDSIALVYGSVMRNLSIALAIALTVLGGEQGAEVAIIISIAFIVQVQSAAWYLKLSDRIFGPPTPEGASGTT